jgi:hypothetical protein
MDYLKARKASERIASSGSFFTAFLFVLVIGMAAGASGPASPDELQDYAAECDRDIGVSVPDFDCDAGTDVPGQGTVFSGDQTTTCDEPNRLNRVCDPGSRFRVLVNNGSAYVVAHCRKQGGDPGMYGDIAVIQYSRTNGATCFYQALSDSSPAHGDMPGGSSAPGAPAMPVKAPSSGLGGFQWKTPTATASIGCGGCHDNGPFVRSPYLNGVTGPNMLPGSELGSLANSSEPYSFVGDAFKNWKAYTVEVSGDECNNCHRLGVNNVLSGNGTSLDFAIRATSDHEDSKNPTSAASPIWMPPDPVQVASDRTGEHAAAAKAIHDCALRFDPNNLPDEDGCRITLFAHDFATSP